MFNTLWHSIFYIPLYNALVFLTSISPRGDVGLAVILLTIVVRFILFPLGKKAVVNQIRTNQIQPELAKIKEDYPNKEEQAKKTLELYKKYKLNPLSGCLLLLIQLPIIIALYRVFFNGFNFDASILYSFVHVPSLIHTHFLGLIDIQKHSIVLAVIAGITQYFQATIAMKRTALPATATRSFQNDLTRSMNTQMKYVFPFFIGFFAYIASGAVALYWVTTNLFTIGQELWIQKKLKDL